jgi:hypothetical protein
MSEPDADRVRAVAEMAQKLGMRLSVVIVGDVRLVLSEPWPKSEQASQADVVREDRAADPELEALRAKGRREFGKRVPDDVLRSLKAVL